jgi:hypothetical protein
MSSRLHPYCAMCSELQPCASQAATPNPHPRCPRHGVRVRSESFPGYHPSPLTRSPPESPPLSLPTAHRHGVWTLAETWYAAHRARLPGGAAGRSASDAVRAAAAAAREIGEMAGGTLVRV